MKEKYLNLATALENVCCAYSDLLAKKITEIRNTEAHPGDERDLTIVDELRALNVLSVTCARCIAMADNQRFGVVNGDLPGTLPI